MKENHWSELLKVTQQITRPGMVKGLLNQAECSTFKRLIARSIQSFAQRKEPFNGLRVFKKGIQENTHNERIITDPPLDDESIEEWSKRFFKDESFGFLMNFLEHYNNDIVEELAKRLIPLTDALGFPWAGFSLLFFMGNYGYTPLGVHRGSPGEDGILFHLGPGTKTFYIWETEEYNRLTNHARNFDKPEDILHASTAYVLEPGDVISFPDDMYHVASTPEFSVSMVLDYQRSSHQNVKKLILKELAKINSNNRQFLARSKDEDLLETIHFLEESKLAVEQLKARLKSNGGFLKKSINKPFSIDFNDSYQLKSPFKLIAMDQEKDQLLVFARGHEINVLKSETISELIVQFNSGNTIDLSSFALAGSPESPQILMFEFLMKIGETQILTKA